MVHTLAGKGDIAVRDDVGTSAGFSYPGGIAIHPSGRYAVITDRQGNVVRRLHLVTLIVSTIAGSAAKAFANGNGRFASFYSPQGITISPDGTHALVADATNNVIRLLELNTLEVSTYCGTTSLGSTNGHCSTATFDRPEDVKISNDGKSIFVADGNTIRVIDSQSLVVKVLSGTGIQGNADGISTSATHYRPLGIAVQDSKVLVSDSGNNRIAYINTTYPLAPGAAPSLAPTISPTAMPSRLPTSAPTHAPTNRPSSTPTHPTMYPTKAPSPPPTFLPSFIPSPHPTASPTISPTPRPSNSPTHIPSPAPTIAPTYNPTAQPTVAPTLNPTTRDPTYLPTVLPTLAPSNAPTMHPTIVPTSLPSFILSPHPTTSPTTSPTLHPSSSPTSLPTHIPSSAPSLVPTTSPPSVDPTSNPTAEPTVAPSNAPTLYPTIVPTSLPSYIPSPHPTTSPTASPTLHPSSSPTLLLTHIPSPAPSLAPTTSLPAAPTLTPSTHHPTHSPTAVSKPTTVQPTLFSSIRPTPTSHPTVSPKQCSSMPHTSHNVSLFAGTPTGHQEFREPSGLVVAIDASYILVIDTYNHVIHKVTASLRGITTYAGKSGISGFRDGMGEDALFNQPTHGAIHPNGEYMLIVDSLNRVIRKVSVYFREVTLLVGSGADAVRDGIGAEASFSRPFGIAISPNGRQAIVTEPIGLRVIDMLSFSVITVYSPPSDALIRPLAISFTPDGLSALIADHGAHAIFAFNVAHNIITVICGQRGLSGYSDGSCSKAKMRHPTSIRVSSNGTRAIVTSGGNHAVQEIDMETMCIHTIAGTGSSGYLNGPALQAQFSSPADSGFLSDGSIVVIDRDHGMLRVIYEIAATDEDDGAQLNNSGGGALLSMSGELLYALFIVVALFCIIVGMGGVICVWKKERVERDNLEHIPEVIVSGLTQDPHFSMETGTKLTLSVGDCPDLL